MRQVEFTRISTDIYGRHCTFFIACQNLLTLIVEGDLPQTIDNFIDVKLWVAASIVWKWPFVSTALQGSTLFSAPSESIETGRFKKPGDTIIFSFAKRQYLHTLQVSRYYIFCFAEQYSWRRLAVWTRKHITQPSTPEAFNQWCLNVGPTLWKHNAIVPTYIIQLERTLSTL